MEGKALLGECLIPPRAPAPPERSGREERRVGKDTQEHAQGQHPCHVILPPSDGPARSPFRFPERKEWGQVFGKAPCASHQLMLDAAKIRADSEMESTETFSWELQDCQSRRKEVRRHCMVCLHGL
ncbi:hypothetical protein J2847_001502 [Azospirillum agricola]|uniref:hypothetical protein n=1 Tax=Azospirillum agricola TaxID=1720247 RepID=UPI001AE24E4F|nr:hypothetical protein [Azospirillum agricola]MBP2228220.1 hypothetical protein [Azospirillum agricola]